MKTWVHFLVSSILAIIFYPIFNWKVLFILVGGVLIDIDHYFWYVYTFKDFNLFKCRTFFYIDCWKDGLRVMKDKLLIFHTLEFLIFVIASSVYSTYALLFAVGMTFHYILDIIQRYYHTKSFITSLSIISWLYKNKIQKV